MVEITQYALNQRSPTEGKGNVQKLSGKPPHALKGQKLLAQGIALGIIAINKTPCKGKSFVHCQYFKAFALTIIFALGKIKR